MNRHRRAAEQQIARGVYHLSPTDRERFVIGIDHVCRLGARIVGEVLIEVTDDLPHLLRVLDDLRRLTPEVAEALAANDWTRPLRAVGRARKAA
jgi:hypothetical protein